MWEACPPSSGALPPSSSAHLSSLLASARAYHRVAPLPGAGGSPPRLLLLDGRPPLPSLDSLWASLRDAERALLASRGAPAGEAAAAAVSPRAPDTSVVIELLEDDDVAGDKRRGGGSGAASSSQQQRSQSSRPPVDPTGMLTWMRDGKIAHERALLPRWVPL